MHHHPFAIGGHHQDRSSGFFTCRSVLPCFIKCIKIPGCSLCQLFYLTFGNMGTRGLSMVANVSSKRALCCIFSHTTAKFKGITLRRKVQLSIQWMKACHTLVPISGTACRYRAKHGFDFSIMGPHIRPINSIGTTDCLFTTTGAELVQYVPEAGCASIPAHVFQVPVPNR